MDFQKFKLPVAKQFAAMSEHNLFRVDIDGAHLWGAYLESFPAGTNAIFRERAEYDCSCCRQFIKAVGNVVAIIDGALVSVWDITTNEPAFQAVANALSLLVKGAPIANVCLHREATAGTDKNFEQLMEPEPKVITWSHFFVRLPTACVSNGVDIGPKLSEYRAQHDVLKRSLEELTDEAVDTVLELIAQNSLYRGEEHQFAVESFRKLKRQYAAVTDRDAFVWSQIRTIPGSVAKIRNTSIGTLLVDLSEAMDMEQAVRKFESVVAPQNYKRPTALVTKKMIENAKATLEGLGLISALERRYARLEDISVNDILFADRSAGKAIGGDVFDSLSTKSKVQTFDRVESIAIEDFIRDIVPRVTSIELLMENRHAGNLMSLIAPADPTANLLFKWDNRFSWSYAGEVADSIKERVKQAGGNVTGDLRCSLSWYNFDDLDLHLIEPNGYEIFYGNARMSSQLGGMLDVDMNRGGGSEGSAQANPRVYNRTPVENIVYANRSTMCDGDYRLFVHNWRKVESVDPGFEVEIEILGDIHHLVYDKPVKHGEAVEVATIKYTRPGRGVIVTALASSQKSKEIWGLKTKAFQRVNVFMMSPNYWSNRAVGNRHYFFMLEGCRNDGQARGFYNEFLREELTPHRKVIEMVGSKMRTEASESQLSGIGFSATKRDEIVVRVKGSFTRDLKVTF